MSGSVTVFVVSPDTRSERRYDLHLTVKQLKAKLESVTGIPAAAQRIALHGSEEEGEGTAPVGALSEDERPLGFYGLRDWQVLKVSDTSPPGVSLAGQFTDVSQVEKFELSEQEYAARRDTVLAYKQRNKLGRFAGDPQGASPSPPVEAPPPPGMAPGQRCEVALAPGALPRRGAVRFVGPTEFGSAPGVWVGVQYDEPVGRNDGSVDGTRYFSCPAPYGGFVRPEKVRVGDFPPVDLDEELEEM
ncbi:CAP Gly-rich domain-containing protein [Phellopilus nigrolimitatus]|nr:CAP Gly-rich domain-containing protein [Phellopilus nigrolimitatus]